VATYEGGSITAADLDRAALDLPPSQRQPADGDLLGWYERIARDLAVQRILLAEAREAGLDKGPDFERARQEARRLAAIAVFLEKIQSTVAPPTPKEIEAYFRAHPGEFKRPAARETYHLFRRLAPAADPTPVMAEARRLRERALAGEDFAGLATQYSESESRHRKGLLGWVTPGSLNPELARIIFSLELKVPSRPLKTREGVHLFLVTAETPARSLTLAEVQSVIGWRLLAERQEAEITRQVGTALPEGSFVPDAEQLRGLVEAGDPAAVVMRVGDFKMTLGELQQRMVAGQVPVTVAPKDSPAHALVAALERREWIYRHCVRLGIDRSPEAGGRLQRLIDRELAGLQLRKRMMERVERDPKRLEEYYQANRQRFSRPLRLRVQRLSVPLSGSANKVMARLEGARKDLDGGRQDFARLAAEMGGTLREPVWEMPAPPTRRTGAVAPAVAGLKPGQHSPPYRAGDHIEMLRVLERAEPEPQPLDRVRDRVRADFVLTHRHDEYAALVEEILGGRHYQVVRSELEAMLKRPLGAGG
jgi:parvulin-like peptidyl-prolyl isomerase